jgi:Double sensory domain of two-component sensor kinase
VSSYKSKSKLTAIDQLIPMGHTKPSRPSYFVIFFLVLLVAGAGLGAFVAQRRLSDAIAFENRGRLDAAKGVFDLLRARALEDMRGQGRILVEDPRLKSTLNTEGIDEATVADILRDLGRLRGAGMLVVLTPTGRVFAEAGAPELRGLDLSASRVVKDAQQSKDSVKGSWVIGNKIFDLSITAIQFESNVIAYLVVGQTLDQALLKSLGTATGVGLGIAIGTEFTAVSDDQLKAMPVLAQQQTQTTDLPPFEQGGASYVANVVELEQMGQNRPRLVLVASLAPTGATFSIFKWLLWLSPVLVLIGIALATGISSNRAS